MIGEKFKHSSRSRKVNNVAHMQCTHQASSCGNFVNIALLGNKRNRLRVLLMDFECAES